MKHEIDPKETSDATSAIHCYESVGFVVTGTDTYAIDGEEWSGKEMELVIRSIL